MEETMHDKSWTIIEKILTYLEKHPNASIKEIAKEMGKTQGNISTRIDKLLKRNIVKRVSFGRYISIRKHPLNNIFIDDKGNVVPKKNVIVKTGTEDFAMNEFIELKETYGRDKLLIILHKWIKILE